MRTFLIQEAGIELANLSPVDSVTFSVPGVKEAKIRMECSLEHSIELGGSDTPGCDFIIGKVVQFHIWCFFKIERPK